MNILIMVNQKIIFKIHFIQILFCFNLLLYFLKLRHFLFFPFNFVQSENDYCFG